jgi:hypothetical protein
MPMSMYRRGSMQGKSFRIYGEADYGHGALPLFLGGGLLPADDPRLSGQLEIVEEPHLNKAVTKSFRSTTYGSRLRAAARGSTSRSRSTRTSPARRGSWPR